MVTTIGNSIRLEDRVYNIHTGIVLDTQARFVNGELVILLSCQLSRPASVMNYTSDFGNAVAEMKSILALVGVDKWEDVAGKEISTLSKPISETAVERNRCLGLASVDGEQFFLPGHEIVYASSFDALGITPQVGEEIVTTCGLHSTDEEDFNFLLRITRRPNMEGRILSRVTEYDGELWIVENSIGTKALYTSAEMSPKPPPEQPA